MVKKIIVCSVVSFISGFFGFLLYDQVSKPDGFLYLDKDTKNIYATLQDDPDNYRKNSRLIFIYKK